MAMQRKETPGYARGEGPTSGQSTRRPQAGFHIVHFIIPLTKSAKCSACVNYYYATVHNTAVIQLQLQVPRTSQKFQADYRTTPIVRNRILAQFNRITALECKVKGGAHMRSQHEYSSRARMSPAWKFCATAQQRGRNIYATK